LSRVFPGADFCAEESGISGDNGGDYQWVIDPLDGTTNFAHGLPHFCISIALAHKKKPIFGMIYQPILDELFWAQSGKGAWFNGNRIHVSDLESVDKSLLVVGLPYGGIEDYRRFWAQVCAVMPRAYAFRHLGAVALDLAYVASGRFDGIFFARLSWWDFAAGDLLIREAGGKTSDFEGNPITATSGSFVAGSDAVHKNLLQLLGSKGQAV